MSQVYIHMHAGAHVHVRMPTPERAGEWRKGETETDRAHRSLKTQPEIVTKIDLNHAPLYKITAQTNGSAAQ